MKKIVIFVIISILMSCASTQYVDVVIEDAAWTTLDILGEESNRTLAVYYFTSSDEADKNLSDYIRQGLTTEIANAVLYEEMNVKVISRQQLDQLMAEQSFQLSDLVDEGTQVEIGQLLGADLILAGQLNRVDEEIYHLNAQVIEVQTGVVLGGFAYDFWVETE